MPTEFVLLSQPVRVVHLSEEAKGRIATLPMGARISILGPSSVPGFLEVVCANVHYSVFEEDLRDRASDNARSAAAP